MELKAFATPKRFHYETMLDRLGGFGWYQRFCIVWYFFSTVYITGHFHFSDFGVSLPENVAENSTNAHAFTPVFSTWNNTENSMRESMVRIKSIEAAGCLFGFLIGGQLSDRYGRRPVYMTFLFLCFGTGLLCGLSYDLTMFSVVVFFNGLASSALWAVQFVWYIEFIPLDYRLLHNVVGASLGYIYAGFLAWLCQDWRKMTFWSNAIAGILLPMSISLDESPKWLISQFRYDVATRILRRIGHNNKTENELLAIDFAFDSPIGKPVNQFYSYHTLFQSRLRASRALTLGLVWFILCTVYFALRENVNEFYGNLYQSFVLIGLMRSVFTVLLVALDKKFAGFGHRMQMQIGFFALAICMTGVGVLLMNGRENPSLKAWLAILGLTLGCGVIWTLVEVYAALIFPTNCRNLGYGLCSTIGCFGSILGPYIFRLSVFWKPMPFLLFAGSCIGTTAVAFFVLPEIKDRSLPDLPIRRKTGSLQIVADDHLFYEVENP